MTSKSSYSNYFKNTLKRKSWLLALSGLAFFLTLTLPALMMIGAANSGAMAIGTTPSPTTGNFIALKQFYNSLTGLMNHRGLAIKIVFVVLAIIAGVSAFAYLHNKAKVDFWGSFPISRKSMFTCNFLASIIPVLAGFLVNFILTHIIIAAFGYGETLISASIWISLAENILYFISTFSIAAVCTLLCGNTIIALILSLVALFGHVATYGLFFTIKNIMYPVYYFGGSDDVLGIIGISPATCIFGPFVSIGITLTPRLILMAVYLVVTVGIIAFGLFCFKKRKGENSGVAIAIDKLKLPLKIYCCIIFGLGFGFIFASFVDSTIWVFFGLIFGILLAHMLSEIVFDFNFPSIFKNWKHSALIVVCCCSVALCMDLDVTGFNTRTIKAENVKSFGFNVSYEGGETLENRSLDSKENIAVITEIIKIAAASDQQDREYNNGLTVYLAVDKKPFGEFKRDYRLPSTEENIALFNQIRYSEEYKRETSDLFLKKLEKAKTATAFSAVSYDENAKEIGGESVLKLLGSMREDYLNLSIEQGHNTTPLYTITFTVYNEDLQGENYGLTAYSNNSGNKNYERYSFPVYSSYAKTLAIFEEEGVTPTRLNAEEIDKIVIDGYQLEQVIKEVEAAQSLDENGDYLTEPKIDENGNNQVTLKDDGAIEFTDKADIEVLIRNASSGKTANYVDQFGDYTEGFIDIYFKDKPYPTSYNTNGKDIYEVVKKNK